MGEARRRGSLAQRTAESIQRREAEELAEAQGSAHGGETTEAPIFQLWNKRASSGPSNFWSSTMTPQETQDHEDAALAAGYTLQWQTYNEQYGAKPYIVNDQDWAPKLNDSDSFRLAIDARIQINPFRDGIVVGSREDISHQSFRGDRYGVSRLAVFNAAAEKGRRLRASLRPNI